jgi:hypothetical protein
MLENIRNSACIFSLFNYVTLKIFHELIVFPDIHNLISLRLGFIYIYIFSFPKQPFRFRSEQRLILV